MKYIRNSVAVLLSFFVSHCALRGASGCDDPVAKQVFDDLQAVELFLKTNSTYGGSQNIGNIRTLIEQAQCNTFVLCAGELKVGNTYAACGAFSTAVPHLEQADRLSVTITPEDASEDQRVEMQFDCQSVLLVALIETEKVTEATTLVARIRELCKAHPELNTDQFVSTLLEKEAQAVAYNEINKATAYDHAIDALASGEVAVLWQMGKLARAAESHLYLGEYEIALENARKAHQLLELHPVAKQYSDALAILRVEGTVHLYLGDTQEALRVFEEGAALTDALLDSDSMIARFQTAWFYAKMAVAQILVAQTNRARVTIEKAIEAARPFNGLAKKLGLFRLESQIAADNVTPPLNDRLKSAKEIMLQADDLAGAALLDMQRTLTDTEFAKLIKDFPDILAMASREDSIELYNRLAMDLEARGDTVGALDNYISAIHLIEEGRIEAKNTQALPLFFSPYVEIYDRAISTLYTLARRGKESSDSKWSPFGRTPAEAALYFAEAAHARQYAELYGVSLLRSFGVRAGLPPDVIERESQLREQLGRVLEPSPFALLSGDPLLLRRKSEEAAQAYRQFLAATISQYPEYADLAFPQPLDVSHLPHSLDDKFVILYKVTDSAVFWWLISGQKIAAFDRVPLKRLALQQDEHDFLRWIDSGAPSNLVTLVQGPFAQIEKIAPRKSSVYSRVVIVPDDVLYKIPFEAIPDLHSGYLADHYIISYAPSLTVLAQSYAKTMFAAPKSALVFGNVQDTNAHVLINGIPQTFPVLTKQYDQVLSTFRKHGYKTVLREGLQAAPDALFSQYLGNYSVIHFDCHAFAETINPLPSLVLHPSSQYPLGLLTLNDVAKLRLRARLVTLSACQTGLGKNSIPLNGEGVEGLARMFMIAGSKSVLVSLWEVHEDGVSALMNSFYQQMMNGTSDEATALFQAKKTLRHGAFKSPSQWAPFILIGNPDN
jgi:tetratricopeptide (TPR) repeat protein